MIKNKKLLILIIFVIFLFGSASITFAAVEVKDGPCAGSTDLGSCVVNFFKWGIAIAGGIAILSFAVGAIMYMISGGSGDLNSSGKDRMKGAVYGIVLLGTSYLIMSTINMALVKPNLTPLSTTELSPVQIPGVYFYLDAGCTQSANIDTTVSLNKIDLSVMGIKVVNDDNNKYGYILHEVENLNTGGNCGQPIINNTSCQPVNMHGAINVFRLNQTPLTSGAGVNFYSEPFGWNLGENALYLKFKNNTIQANSLNNKKPDSMIFSYEGVNVPDPYKEQCKTFQKCPRSIDIKGEYLVAVYSDVSYGGSSGDKYCQTFEKSVANLFAEPVVAAGGNNISDIYIIATGGK